VELAEVASCIAQSNIYEPPGLSFVIFRYTSRNWVARRTEKRRHSMFARLVTIGGRREQLDEFVRIGTEKVLPQLKRLDGFEGSLLLANRRSGEIVAVSLWESEGAMRATEGASYWLRAFGAEAAGGEVTGLDRYEVVSSEAWRAQP
jgi:heme-degrading monooxygenase HmoA